MPKSSRLLACQLADGWNSTAGVFRCQTAARGSVILNSRTHSKTTFRYSLPVAALLRPELH
jgi:hypothetical protein